MTKTNTVFLVRHGENRANVTREFSYKKVDYSLTEKGVTQAEQTAAYFAALNRQHPIDAIYSSPLKRAKETAAIVAAATGHRISLVEELREINCGEFDGAPPTQELWEHHDRIMHAWRDGDHTARFPGGEDFHELRARARRALGQAVTGRAGARIVVVAHGGLIGATLSDVCPDLDPLMVWTVPNRNCAVTEIELHTEDGDIANARGILKRFADCGHLA
jgi:probable phosphoglycerate mutase